jgi:hypothetical protein
MTIELSLLVASGIAMLLAMAALDALLPRNRRAWWSTRAMQVYAPRHERVAQADADAATEFEEPAFGLQLVETVDRRNLALPFVGKDRRQVASPEVKVPRVANGD